MRRAAFSLIEVCLVVALLAALGGFGVVMNMGAYRNYILRGEAGFVANLLRRARGQATNNINALPHGVHFGGGQYVMFVGPDWDSRDSRQDVAFPASPGVSVSATGDIIFLQLSGSPKNAGNINIGGYGRSLTINVNQVGQINSP